MPYAALSAKGRYMPLFIQVSIALDGQLMQNWKLNGALSTLFLCRIK